MQNSQPLELYLSQIEHELRALPPQARADELREIEAHLCAMLETRGDVAAVLAQFGKPRKVGRELRRAWERKQPESWINGALALVLSCAFAGWHNEMKSKLYLYATYANQNFFIAHSIVKTNAVEVINFFAFGLLIGLFSPRRKFAFITFTMAFMFILDPRPHINWNDLFITAPLRYEILIPFLIIGAFIGARNSKKFNIINFN